MVPARISLVTLGSRDIQVMRNFYRALGWEESTLSSEGFAMFKTSGGVLALFLLDLLAADANAMLTRAAGAFKGVTLAINVERREQVDEAIAAARAAGARIVKDPEDASWGGRSAYFGDPEDNLWEVAWLPDASFDERGGMIVP